ncbi:MAG: magnesium transporter [Alphaproteobacteria bacterium]|jgi:magnesium transporter|nr:magnesium transporter [Alphaproteobacteria bacterium]MBP7729823.1 magnesium transporter [Alphaproteobacteria bacterium]
MIDKTHFQEQSRNENESLYGVSQDTIRALEEALSEGEESRVERLIQPLHEADVATVIEYLSPHLRHCLVEILRPRFDPDILTHLDETVRDEVVEQLGTREIAEAITELESNDAIALIEDLEEKQQKEILDFIPIGERVILEEVLTYPEDSAARLMQREVVCVPSFWTVEETMYYLVKEESFPEKFYDLFVVDSKHAPIGGIPLSLLLRQPPSTKISDIMEGDIKRIPALMDQEEVALLFRKYGLVSAPVVDEEGRIVGMITVDDVVDVIEEEAEQDIMLLSRVTESDFYEPLLSTSYSRIRWLMISLFNTLLAATVISQFQYTIEKMVALAVLMPINAAMSGNAGMQVVTVTVRALATRELGGANMRRAIRKEVLVGLINGIVFGGLMGAIGAFWFSDPALGIVLGGALIFNMIWAALWGVLLPILINKMGMDPALSAGPFLTASTDLLGFAIFLGSAKLFLF